MGRTQKWPCYTGRMRTNILSTAIALSDQDLLARIESLAGTEREATAQLVGHLAALELRPSLYAAQGYGSLFGYCIGALSISEDAACSRISAARACRRFPIILDHLASGALTLTSVRLLAPHLTAENHEAVVARAMNKARAAIEALVAELAPRPDVPSAVRRLPEPATARSSAAPTKRDVAMAATLIDFSGNDSPSAAAIDQDNGREQRSATASASVPLHPQARPIVKALATHRYRVQFTIGQEAYEQLRQVQTLLRREIPNGDPGAIFERALALLAKEVEKARLGRPSKPRRPSDAPPRRRVYETRIRLETDKPAPSNGPSSRHITKAVKRAVWQRDGGQCAFVSPSGRRCAERSFLELHHIHPYALEGPATLGNISLRCRRHNQHEAELVFGPRGPSTARETPERYRRASAMP